MILRAPTPLYVYRVRFWSSVDWEWTEAELLASCEHQVRAWVDEQTSLDYRRKRVMSMPRDTLPEQWPDSLLIECIQTVDQLPFILCYPNR